MVQELSAWRAVDIPYRNHNYLYLWAANIGAVVMPWMVFYQQSALADKRLRAEHLTAARWDTAIGALLTQLIITAVLVACDATTGRANLDASLATVGEMAEALTPFLGTSIGNLIFGLGVLGAGMVAAIVVSLAFAWGLGESPDTAARWKCDLWRPAGFMPFARYP
jgi:Mn2+/Fe2+ NRAMP family transporter